MIWHVAKQLLYLGIVVALLLSSQSHLETRVIALLILIYNHVTLAAGSLGLALDGIQVQVSNELKRVARSMKLRAPVWDLKTEEEFRLGAWLNSLSGLSAYVGSLIAVVALIWSLF
jgi:hypothetical protein